MRNFLLLVLVLVLCLVLAPYFGSWYDKFSYQYGDWVLDKDGTVFFAGLFVSYVALVPFVFELLGSESKKKWIIWLLIPPALLWIFADIYYIYIPIILALISFFLAWLLRKMFVKNPNPPVVIK
jgi:hypothetical protein